METGNDGKHEKTKVFTMTLKKLDMKKNILFNLHTAKYKWNIEILKSQKWQGINYTKKETLNDRKHEKKKVNTKTKKFNIKNTNNAF